MPSVFKPEEANCVSERLRCIVCTFDQTTAASPMTVDEIAYFYFVRASRNLSHLCELAMEQSPNALFSVYLKRRMVAKNPRFSQSCVLEAVDVSRSLIALHQDHP